MTRKRWAALALAAGLLSSTGCAMFGDSSGGGWFSGFGRMCRGNGGACCAGGEVVSGDIGVGVPVGGGGTCCGSTPGVIEGAPPTIVAPAMPAIPAPLPPTTTLPTAPPPRIAPIPQAAPVPYTP